MITFPVGEKGQNFRKDVLLVQTLLKTKGYSPGPVDGVCGQKTVKAIREFQSKFLDHVDGLVEPNRETWRKLCSPESGSTSINLIRWNGDSALWTQDKKIMSLAIDLRPKVKAVVEALKKRGFSPTVFYGWRSVAAQLRLYNQGNSKVKFSFHNAQRPDGTPNSYAADIIDNQHAWSNKAETSGFWKALGEEAKKQNLYWGGDWSSFRDWAHVQLVPNSQLAKIKRESGL